MAVKTIELPAIGKVRREWAYAGGALIVGVAGYAWWTRAPEEPELLVDEFGNIIPPSGALESVTPTMTGFSGGEFDPQAETRPPSTNAEWSVRATDYLTGIGYDPLVIATGLGKFLTRQELSRTETAAVQAAIATFGEPPVGGPWTIRTEPPAPPPRQRPAPITSVRATRVARHAITWRWNTSPGATKYRCHLRRNYERNRSGINPNIVQQRIVTKPEVTFDGLISNFPYQLCLRAEGTGGHTGYACDIVRTRK